MFHSDSDMTAIGSDHAGAPLRQAVMQWFKEQGLPFIDCGTDQSPSDYPVIAEKVCGMIRRGEATAGILLCGTGIGMSMAANKMKGIRAAVCSEAYSAKYARLHNDANVLCMGARVVGEGLACEILRAFVEAEYEGGRHQRRVDMVMQLEQNQEE